MLEFSFVWFPTKVHLHDSRAGRPLVTPGDEFLDLFLFSLDQRLDVTVHPGTGTSAIEPDGDRLLARLGNGTELDVDLVVFSAGVRPRDDLARAAGSEGAGRGGIVGDAACRTRGPAGDAGGGDGPRAPRQSDKDTRHDLTGRVRPGPVGEQGTDDMAPGDGSLTCPAGSQR